MSERISSSLTTEQCALSDRFIDRVTAMLPEMPISLDQYIPTGLWHGQAQPQRAVADYELASPVSILAEDYPYVSVFMFEYDGGHYFYGMDFRRDKGDEEPSISLYSDSGDDILSGDGLEMLNISPLPIRKQTAYKQKKLEQLFTETLQKLDATVAYPLTRSEPLTRFN